MAGTTLPPPGLLPKFDNTLGALLVGGLAATALWGVTCVQTYTFFMGGSTDRASQKTLVALLWVLDTFDTVLNCHILYFYLVTNYLNPEAIIFPVWSIIVHVAATALSNFIVRSAFARRVYRLSNGNIPGTVWLVVLSTLDLTCGIIITAKAFTMKTFFQLISLSSLMYLNFAAGTAADLSVALALCYLLRGSRTGFERTDSLIRMLMKYAVNTGLIVAFDAAAGMLSFVFMPTNFIFLGFYLLLSKLYLNSYLAILNAGPKLRERLGDPKTIHLSRIQSTMRWRSGYDAEGQISDSQPTLALSKPEFPQPVDRISRRKRFSPNSEGFVEGFRDQDDERLARNWLAGEATPMCEPSITSLSHSGKTSGGSLPILPSEILHEIFDRTIPSEIMLNANLSCGPDSPWCSSMVTKRALVLVCRSWYNAGIDLLYRTITIRRVPGIQALLSALVENPLLGGFVRSITIACFVPRTYRATIHPDLTRLIRLCPALTSLNHLPPFPPPKPFRFPALPSTVTSLKFALHEELSTVYATLQLYCGQLEELSIRVVDDEVFDALELDFPRLHTLHLTLGGNTVTCKFSANWRTPKLTHLTFHVSTDLEHAQFLDFSYEDLLRKHGRGLQYLAFPGVLPAGSMHNQHLPVMDFAPLLARCPGLEHVVLPADFGLDPQSPTFPTIKWLDVWTQELYENLAFPRRLPLFPNIISPRFLDTGLIALMDDVPRAFDPRVRGDWFMKFPGLSIRQDERDGLLSIQLTDLLAVDDWHFTYFGAVEIRAVRREQEVFDYGGGNVRMAPHNLKLQEARRKEYADSQAMERPTIHPTEIYDDPEIVDDLAPDLFHEWLEDESDGGSEDSWFSLESEEDNALGNEFYDL
ncbi:hypothetical protein B0H16DRAFT_1737112 [Mycena metata]|uniref:DUF6534 domain-containing protein n=1 Tax=Mycena metata TaxID=1033252 RepID=A0AAD7HMZ5_9AGAR|nr:hypothetical protein B0H16DRAFT_1737112 [Mycena metata]